jgi:hypothetical protein
MPIPIQFGGAQLDLSPRLFKTATVVASPATTAETIIASLTINEDLALMEGVVLLGYAAFTVGASGSAVNLRLRRTDASGTIVKASGATTVTAADLRAYTIAGVDTGVTPLNQVYVMTMTVTAGAAESTVSAVTLAALVI